MLRSLFAFLVLALFLTSCDAFDPTGDAPPERAPVHLRHFHQDSRSGTEADSLGSGTSDEDEPTCKVVIKDGEPVIVCKDTQASDATCPTEARAVPSPGCAGS